MCGSGRGSGAPPRRAEHRSSLNGVRGRGDVCGHASRRPVAVTPPALFVVFPAPSALLLPDPHEKLHAYQEARNLLICVHDAKIADGKLRDQAMRAARSICLNIAEGAGRSSVPDKARVYAIARGETCEVVAALEIALRDG